jgi:hypothetical protein
VAQRNKKSVYYCFVTGQLDQATKFRFAPRYRPHRFLFIGFYYRVPRMNENIRTQTETDKRFRTIKKEVYIDDDLPF